MPVGDETVAKKISNGTRGLYFEETVVNCPFGGIDTENKNLKQYNRNRF